MHLVHQVVITAYVHSSGGRIVQLVAVQNATDFAIPRS